MIVQRLSVCFIIFLGGLLSNNTIAADNKYYKETFENIESIKIESVSGDLILSKSIDGKVHVDMDSDYSPAENYKYKIEPDNGVLEIKESFIGSTIGSSSWSIELPDQVEIEFESASGILTIKNLEIDVQADMASGEVEIINCKGAFNISTASGNINATGISLSKESKFISSSGDVELILVDVVNTDLTIASVSGDAVLDYNSNPVTGTIKIEIRQDKGSISSEIPFDYQETTSRVARNSQSTEEIGKEKNFITKIIKTNKERQLISISTEVGSVELKK